LFVDEAEIGNLGDSPELLRSEVSKLGEQSLFADLSN
jgi:hypothetical protein